jgi:hypothetical protein
MGDTFDRVLEVSKESQLREICSFINEYITLVPTGMIEKNSVIFIGGLEKDEGHESQGSWEGKLGALKIFFSKSLAAV